MSSIFETEIGGKKLKVETRKMAEQASGSVMVQYGDTLVLATAVMSDFEREGIDFFPLTVEYEERFYAAGKILGSRYVRRESRPSDEAILTARFIDRAIRPRFPKNLKKEVQVVVTCLSWDGENDPDVIGLLAASLALSVSNIPWSGPIASLRVGKANGDLLINPSYEQRVKKELDISLAAISSPLAKFLGNKSGDEILINMIESEANEVQEDLVVEAIGFAKPYLKQLIDFQSGIIEKAGKEKTVIEQKPKDLELEQEISGFLAGKIEKAIYVGGKNGLDNLKADLIEFIKEAYPEPPPGGKKGGYAKEFFEEKVNDMLHENIIKHDKRPDGRKLDEIRTLQAEVGILPRTHGSGLFARGLTRSLSILTLGAPGDVKVMEGMEIRGKKHFMHHYNFPPYCSGEVKPMRGPGRREIGHGMLGEKALLPVIPNFDEFPYTIRIVTEILSSNGSTSMASPTSASLALMDAGVPIKRPVTGIAMGLIHDGKGTYKVLTDIQGAEDHHGDMDFKVTGTENGITAMQMDVKTDGIGDDIIKKTLEGAREARLRILKVMAGTIDKPRAQLSPFAPRVLILQINPEKIREVIGPGGKVINQIIDECGVSIDIEDSGKVFITAEKESAGEKALSWIKNITREVMVGELFQGRVTRILNFGAFVEILPGQEGLVHISQLANYRVAKVEDIVKIGDMIPVKVISIDDQGRINLSLKEAKKH
jgi:polyribonucleotide nucleotidyltransferase